MQIINLYIKLENQTCYLHRDLFKEGTLNEEELIPKNKHWETKNLIK